jgi:hypothetical protein
VHYEFILTTFIPNAQAMPLDHCEKCLNDSNQLGPYDIQIFSKLKSINKAVEWNEFSQCKLWICDDCMAKIIRGKTGLVGIEQEEFDYTQQHQVTLYYVLLKYKDMFLKMSKNQQSQ